MIGLLIEFGHCFSLEEVTLNDLEELAIYFEHDWTLSFSDEPIKFSDLEDVEQIGSMHHLLRDHGEYNLNYSKAILNWLVSEAFHVVSDDEEMEDMVEAPVWQDLREAAIYAMMEDEVGELFEKDWFLLFLQHFDIAIHDLFPCYYTSGISYYPITFFAVRLQSYSPYKKRALHFVVEELQADIDAADGENFRTALGFACYDFRMSVDAIKDLIELGAHVNAVDVDGLTALDHAIKNATPVRLLLQDSWDKCALLLLAGALFGPKSSYTYQSFLGAARSAKTQGHEVVLILESMNLAPPRRQRKKRKKMHW